MHKHGQNRSIKQDRRNKKQREKEAIIMSKAIETWICSYDICHAKRLYKIHKLLSNIGIALNYSVFYLQLTTQQFKTLCQCIERLVHHEDDVRLYRCMPLHKAQRMTHVETDILFLSA